MNELKVTQQQTIIARHEQGWSKRKIARELGVDRQTVRRFLALRKLTDATRPTVLADGHHLRLDAEGLLGEQAFTFVNVVPSGNGTAL